MSKKRVAASRTLHYYWNEVKQQWRYNLPLIFVIPTAVFLNSYATAWIISATINRLTEAPVASDQVFTVFGPYLLLYVVSIFLGEMIFWRLLLWLCWKGEIVAMANLRQRCFDKLTEQSMHFHNEKFGGALVNQIQRFVGSYERLLDAIIWRVIPLITSLTAALLILGFVLPWFALILGTCVFVFITFAWFSFKSVRHLNEKEATASSKMTAQIADSVTNVMTVKSFACEPLEKTLFGRRNRAWFGASRELMRAIIKRDIGFGAILVILAIATFVFLIGGNAWFGVGIGTLYLAVAYMTNIWGQLWQFNGILRDFNRVFGDAQEMTAILDEPIIVKDAPHASSLKVSRGVVEFRNVSFSHTDSGGEEVFHKLDLKIPAGQRIGLVGHSGSGKTTLTRLLLRFADVQSGEILIDDKNIADVTQSSLRHAIAYVPQEPLLFHRTIAENIAYGRPNANDVDVREAARLANALEFVEKLPDGFKTMVGERGVKLSGGQRQRIAIARAILRDAPILVLDEATSALDTESEKLIQQALKRLMKDRTSIVIAHRLSTVAELDRIIVLDDGKIIEDDTHANLIAHDGKYARLWNRQTGFEIND
ncbi:MAG: ABC transporter ATP-binding protein/permease [Candidatus Nomurabacteria bacterium]|jgi:ATP-binding cassette subfamily B protein|nr:ABC transporter ATP-binding protein/permease [Candidatus Nomurabacteria bacterium]